LVQENEAVDRAAQAMMIAASLGEDLGVDQEPGHEWGLAGHNRPEAVVAGDFEFH
jgi:hypothetical protein